MHRISRYLTFLSLITILVIGVNTFFLFTYLDQTRQDTEMVNQLGIIRGSIQRYTKKELNGSPSPGIEEQIETILNEKRQSKFFSADNQERYEALNKLTRLYLLLKEDVNLFREKPTPQLREKILSTSEELWVLADNIVLRAQNTYESMTMILYLLTAGLVLAISILLFLVHQIKKTIRDHLEYDAHYDQMTDTLNRSAFRDEAARQISIFTRMGHQLSFVMFDIDHFKSVNDKFGHDKGDIVLKELTKLIQNHIRLSDRLGRLGGEEFAILLPETDLAHAVDMAEKIRSLTEKATLLPQQPVTISLGVSTAHESDTTDTLIKRADVALYRAKKGGRNRVKNEEPEVAT